MVLRRNNEELPSELRTVLSRLIKKLRNKSSLRERLSLTERSVIGLLDQHKEMFPSELAAIEKVTTQSMSQIINHLSELGYINRIASEKDKRKVIISLSAAGKEILNTVRNERDEWLSNAIQGTCTAEEVEILYKALIPLTKLVDFDQP